MPKCNICKNKKTCNDTMAYSGNCKDFEPMHISVCSNCGRHKVITDQGVIGFPDHIILGSRKEYCAFCDEPPIVTLESNKSIILERTA